MVTDASNPLAATLRTGSTTGKRRSISDQQLRGRWRRFTAIAIITALMLAPILAVVYLSLLPSLGSTTTSSITTENFVNAFEQTSVLVWLKNSLIVSAITVLVAVAVAAPAGYVISRGRNKLVSGYSLMLFIVQSLPVVTAVIPLFALFAKLGLVDSLVGLTIIYVGSTMSVAIWMMAAYYDSIPVSLEEAAWIDGCSLFGGFVRIVLRNALPGVLSTAIFSFILAWNDYLIALVFIRSDPRYTLPIGLETFFQQNQTNLGLVMASAVIMMLPPIILFFALNKYFSVGGIGGSLSGT